MLQIIIEQNSAIREKHSQNLSWEEAPNKTNNNNSINTLQLFDKSQVLKDVIYLINKKDYKVTYKNYQFIAIFSNVSYTSMNF